MVARYRVFLRQVTTPATDPKAVRDALTVGQYKPVADGTINATAGWLNDPAITMTTINTTQNLTVAGTVLQNAVINGRVIVSAANCIIRNCRILGPTPQPAAAENPLISATAAGVSNLLVEDCSIVMQAPQNSYNGITGHDFTLKRCHLAQITDGIGIYNTNALTAPANVNVLGCVVEKMVKWYPDTVTTSHTDGTHNDCIQIQQGNGSLLIRGNVLDATLSTAFGNTTPAGSNVQSGGTQFSPTNFNGNAVIQLNELGGGITANLQVEDNYFYGGNVGINASDPALSGNNMGVWQRNKFNHTQYNPTSATGTNTSGTMLFRTDQTVTIPTTSPNWNTYEDNGVQVLVRKQ